MAMAGVGHRARADRAAVDQEPVSPTEREIKLKREVNPTAGLSILKRLVNFGGAN
jgi:hypothetical protein